MRSALECVRPEKVPSQAARRYEIRIDLVQEFGIRSAPQASEAGPLQSFREALVSEPARPRPFPIARNAHLSRGGTVPCSTHARASRRPSDSRSSCWPRSRSSRRRSRRSPLPPTSPKTSRPSTSTRASASACQPKRRASSSAARPTRTTSRRSSRQRQRVLPGLLRRGQEGLGRLDHLLLQQGRPRAQVRPRRRARGQAGRLVLQAHPLPEGRLLGLLHAHVRRLADDHHRHAEASSPERRAAAHLHASVGVRRRACGPEGSRRRVVAFDPPDAKISAI